MASAKERLQKIIDNVTLDRLVFSAKLVEIRPQKTVLLFEPRPAGQQQQQQQNIKLNFLPNQDKLQDIIAPWFSQNIILGKLELNHTVESLFTAIKRNVAASYDQCSERCLATKRKTTDFIKGISLNDPILANFVIAMFMETESASFEKKTGSEKIEILKVFDSLRRKYGKSKDKANSVK